MYADTNYTLPNMLSINVDGGSHLPARMNVTNDGDLKWASSAMTPQFLAVLNASIANVTVLAFTQEPCRNQSGSFACPHNVTVYNDEALRVDYQATTCTLYTCVKNYDASVNNSALLERVVSTTPVPQYNSPFNNSLGLYSWDNYTLVQTPCAFGNETY